MAGAGDRDVAEAGVKQVRVDAGIGVNENAFGGEALGAVAGDCVAVVEVTVLAGLDLDLAVVVEARREPTIGMDGLDNREVPIGDAEGICRAPAFRTSRRDFGAYFSMLPELRDYFVEFSDAT
jgi:hypothetical protein